MSIIDIQIRAYYKYYKRKEKNISWLLSEAAKPCFVLTPVHNGRDTMHSIASKHYPRKYAVKNELTSMREIKTDLQC